MHALVVEDNPVNQLVVTEMLAIAGAECDVAENGREAMTLMARTVYDCVLMDLHMPIMDGMSAMRAQREREATHGAPRQRIFAVTADAMDDQRTACLAAGFDGFLAKPFELEDLMALLGTLTPGVDEPST